eukprot:TRINITY_DN6556_c0_g1_i1.p1 TRINITY_DN6556_c0_g1~~TRINITY_DN6556_c0_g1_i1.p1  ORF type:complete len:272 (+),score=51.89 TRINITY_DN6556_c0_g1_i1:83-898(+)
MANMAMTAYSTQSSTSGRSPKKLDRKAQAICLALERSSSTSSLPSVSRAISNLASPGGLPRNRSESYLPEYVGGAQRWRFHNRDWREGATRQETAAAAAASSKAAATTCSHVLHPVTVAGGWDREVAAQKELIIRSYGYQPGLPRSQKPQSLLGDFLPRKWRAFSGEYQPVVARKPVGPKKAAEAKEDDAEALKGSSQEGKPVEIFTRKDIRVVKCKPDGERLILKRWESGFNACPPARHRADDMFEDQVSTDAWKDGLRKSAWDSQTETQ